MSNLLMISGDRALAEGKHGAFYNTLEEFHKHWDQIDIICPRPNSKFKIQNLKLFDNVEIHPSPWPLIFQPLWIYREGLSILKIRNSKFEIRNWIMTVHEFPPFYNGIGARLLWSRLFKEKSRILDSRSESGQKTGVPYVLEIFHIPGHPRASGIKEIIYKFLFKLFIRFDASKAKAVRVMNQKQVPDFLIGAGVPRDKIIYIPAIYVDLDIFKPMNPPKEYDLIFVGRLEKNKGIHLLLKAIEFSILNFKFPIKCLIVGDGSLMKNLKLEIQNSKLQDNVLFHGWAKDSREVAELINRSKILVMPSYNEGGPRVVVEAMACGVPVLATPVGIVPDLLKNGPDTHENGEGSVEDPRFANHALHGANRDFGGEITSWEPKDIAQKAEGLLNNPNKLSEYRLNGLEMAKHFEKKEAIKNYAEKLKEILG